MANDRLELCESTSAYSWGSRRESSYIKDKRGLNSKIHLAVNERGLPVKFIVAEEMRADCKEAINLLKNLDEDYYSQIVLMIPTKSCLILQNET